jgi:hypothetical protein
MKTHITLVSLFLLAMGCTNQTANNSIASGKNPNSVESESTIEENKGQNHTLSSTPCELSKILGTWRANEDKKSELIIGNDFLIHKYENANIDSLGYRLTDKLDSDKANIKPSCYMISKDIENDVMFEYEIVSVSEKTLTLMNLDRGNLLVYNKEK